jgi:hypothetical protein
MTLSQPIDNRSDTRSCRFIARNAGARHPALESCSLATSILALAIQHATSLLRPHQRVAANRLPLPLRAKLRRSQLAAKSP